VKNETPSSHPKQRAYEQHRREWAEIHGRPIPADRPAAIRYGGTQPVSDREWKK